MLDPISLDQLRVFVAVAEQGSFSAAGRKLLRAQSVISQSVANLEAQMNVSLFDRKTRYPILTKTGQILLQDAKAIIHSMDSFKSKAQAISAALEPELCMAVDVMFPKDILINIVRQFILVFPTVKLSLHVEALGAVIQNILSKECDLGVVGSLPDIPDALISEHLLDVKIVMVAASHHPLAQAKQPISREALAGHPQIILTDRTELSRGREFGIMSANIWKLTDLSCKHSLILEGIGWGGMPLSAVQADIEANKLSILHIEDEPEQGVMMPISVVHSPEYLPGIASRWMIDRLKNAKI